MSTEGLGLEPTTTAGHWDASMPAGGSMREDRAWSSGSRRHLASIAELLRSASPGLHKYMQAWVQEILQVQMEQQVPLTGAPCSKLLSAVLG